MSLDVMIILYILSIDTMRREPSSIVLSQTGGPLYQQIVNQIKEKIAFEDWAAGEELPSIRQLAADLRVSVITVKRAYLELEREGVIVTQQGKGSFVTTDVEIGAQLYEEKMAGHLEEAARLGTTLGMSDGEIVSRLRKALDEVDDTRPVPPTTSKESQ